MVSYVGSSNKRTVRLPNDQKYASEESGRPSNIDKNKPEPKFTSAGKDKYLNNYRVI